MKTNTESTHTELPWTSPGWKNNMKTNTWNMWSPEVSRMRTMINDYGGPAKYRNAPGHSAGSFRQQALVELASRLNLEDQNEDLRKQVNALHARVEHLECEAQIAGRPQT